MNLKKFGIENFRIFKGPVEFEFRPITILVGENNSGKSTLLKAIRVLKENASLFEKEFPAVIHTDLINVGLGGIQHFITTGQEKIPFKVSFQFDYDPTPEYFIFQKFLFESKISMEYEVEKERNQLNCFKLEFVHESNSRLNLSMISEVDIEDNFKREIWHLSQDVLGDIYSLMNENYDGLVLLINKYYDSYKKRIQGSSGKSISGESIYSRHEFPIVVQGFSYEFNDLENILAFTYSIEYFTDKFFKTSENTVPEKILIFQEMLKKHLNREFKCFFSFDRYSEYLIYFEGDLLHGYFHECMIDYFERFKKYFSERFTNIESNRSNPKRYYSPGDVDQLSSVLFSNKFKKEDADEIVKDVLGIADEINVETIDGYLKKVTIRKNGVDYNLVDVGYGISQLLPFIINPDYDFESYYGDTEHTWLVSEPEANLHPSLQSRLADLFVHLNSTKFSEFIIETHSEYLIRKLQYLVKQTSSHLQAKDVVIYYMYHPDEIPPGEAQVKKIEIDEEGNLTDNFGPGFYDESSRISLELWNLNTSQKN